MDCEPAVEEAVSETTSEFLEKPSFLGAEHESRGKKPPQSVAGPTRDLRHRRRSRISSNAEIVQWNSVQVNPDVAGIVDASSGGLLFMTDREYKVGAELIVRFPFPSASAPKQKGTVVRVENMPGGQRRVAVRLD
jgi:hypothetical protein